MIRFFRALMLWSAFSLFAVVAPASADTKLALVVGVSKYDHLKALDIAKKDAEAMNAALGGIGFVVTYLPDPTQSEIVAAWKDLLSKVTSNGDVVLFYYAGHGIELRGSNYLIPREVAFNKDPAKVISGAIGLQDLMGLLATDVQKKFEDTTGIFIIDACRENPFKQQDATATAGEIGLAPLNDLPKNVFVMYSAGIGQLALDGKKESKNSVYTTRLLATLGLQKSDPLALADLAQRIRHSVYLDAKTFNVAGKPHYQTPAYYDQLQERRSIFGQRVDQVKLEMVEGTAVQRFDEAQVRSLGARDIIRECELCPELTVIAQGSFQMGTRQLPKDSTEKPVPEDAYFDPSESHKGQKLNVTIPQSFAMGRFEVTVGEWNACVVASVNDPEGCRGLRDVSGRNPRYRDRDPVTDVTWSDAQSYVKWLNKATKQPKTLYRLPTEAEWEYAARAGLDGKLYGFGDDMGKLCDYGKGADGNIGSLAWVNLACKNARSDTDARSASQVGRFKPNDWDLFDMHGNVAEWVEDCWQDGYDETLANAAARDGPANCARRVIRGGSWRSGPAALRSSARNAAPPSVARSTIGFRIVRDLY